MTDDRHGGRQWIDELLARGSYRELAERASARAAEDPAGTALARAELAWLGTGPVYDLAAAARRAAAEGWPEAPALARRVSPALLRASASSLASELEDGGHEAFDEQAPISRWRIAEVRVSEAAAVGDVAAARRWAEEAAAIEGDGIEARRLRAALWQWRGGETAEAAERVRQLAGDIRAGTPTPETRELLADAEAALAAVDRKGAGPRWITLAVNGDLDAEVATAAHALRILKDRGPVIRATLTVETAVAAAEAGAAVWIEIEGPVRLAALRGIDAESGMALVSWEGRTELMPWARLERLSGVFGLGALVLSSTEAMPPVEADPRLATLDACDLDEEGETPPRGFVFHTARTALAAEPSWTRALWRWGRELADGFEQGYVKADDVFPWYADAREHAAQASWTFAIYAQVLAAQERGEEALMAWRDALRRAPDDLRLAVRCAEALRAAGRPSGALAVLEPALGEAPESSPDGEGAYEVAAGALLAQGDLERARAAAEIELAINPGSAGAVHALVSALERSGRPGDNERARSVLAQGRERNPEHAGLALRAAVAASRAGAWPEAHAQAADLLRIADDANTNALAARLRYCDGDLEGAWSRVTAAHARFPTADSLFTVGSAVLAALPPGRLEAALAELAEKGPPEALHRWAYTLSEAGLHEPAIALADRVAATGSANGLWQAARCRLRQGTADRVAAIAALRGFVDPTSGFILGRCSLAAALLPGDPEGALAALDADFGDYTPLRWLLEAEALEAQGQSEEAARLRSRLAEAGAAISSSTINTARRLGFPAHAAALAATARAAGNDDAGLIVEQAASLAALGDRTAAAAVLAPLEAHSDPGPAWPIASIGLTVGAHSVVAAAARRALAWLADTRSWDLDDGADPWWYTAALAVAGPDEEARARLEAGAPRHPSAWAVFTGAFPR